jgi:hypothetical protein
MFISQRAFCCEGKTLHAHLSVSEMSPMSYFTYSILTDMLTQNNENAYG